MSGYEQWLGELDRALTPTADGGVMYAADMDRLRDLITRYPDDAARFLAEVRGGP